MSSYLECPWNSHGKNAISNPPDKSLFSIYFGETKIGLKRMAQSTKKTDCIYLFVPTDWTTTLLDNETCFCDFPGDFLNKTMFFSRLPDRPETLLVNIQNVNNSPESPHPKMDPKPTNLIRNKKKTIQRNNLYVERLGLVGVHDAQRLDTALEEGDVSKVWMDRYSAALIPLAWRVVPNLSEGLRWAGVLLGSVEFDVVGPMAEMPLRSESPRIALTSASVVQGHARRPSCSPRVRRQRPRSSNCFALSRTRCASTSSAAARTRRRSARSGERTAHWRRSAQELRGILSQHGCENAEFACVCVCACL